MIITLVGLLSEAVVQEGVQGKPDRKGFPATSLHPFLVRRKDVPGAGRHERLQRVALQQRCVQGNWVRLNIYHAS